MTVTEKISNLKIRPSSDPIVNRLALAIDLLVLFSDKEQEESKVSAEQIAAKIGRLASLLDEDNERARQIP